MRVTFFCFAKRKSPKKRRPPVCDPHAVRGGKPASCRLRGAPWNSLCAGARRSDIHGESVHEARALRRACSPRNRPAAGAASRGGQPNIQTTEQSDIHSGHRFARPRLRSAWRLCHGIWGRAKQRPVWLFCTPVPLWMRRGAQGLADQGSRLSERSEFERDPAKPEHRRLPRSKAQGTQTVGSPFLWFLSFGDAKERDSHAGRLPASALNEGTRFDARKPTDSARAIDA